MNKSSEQNHNLLDEVSRLNNELINIRRELTKKNAELKQNQIELKKKNEELEALIQNLSERVSQEVNKNMEKENHLIFNSRYILLGEMIGNIAHQWKQPLNVLGVILQNIQMNDEAGVATHEFIEKSSKKGMDLINYMSQTVDDFRGFLKPDKEKKLFSVRSSIDQTLNLLNNTIKNNGIKVIIKAEHSIQLFGYRNEFCQVLINIIKNALDAIAEAKVEKPVIEIESYVEESKTIITIGDNAGGIPESILDKVFDAHFTTKDDNNGTGIGLYMSRMIVEKIGGTLTVRNKKDGAEFKINV